MDVTHTMNLYYSSYPIFWPHRALLVTEKKVHINEFISVPLLQASFKIHSDRTPFKYTKISTIFRR